MPLPPRRQYNPPQLRYRIRLRNPASRPNVARDDFGRIETEPQWGVVLWAGKRDRDPQQVLEEGAVVYANTTIWTIRYRDGVDPDVEVVFREKIYRSIGPPVERGGHEFGRGSRYLEIHTRLRE